MSAPLSARGLEFWSSPLGLQGSYRNVGLDPGRHAHEPESATGRPWGLTELAVDTELLVSELVINAVKATTGQQQATVRLQLSSDDERVLVEVWDADPQPAILKDLGEDGTPDPGEEADAGCSW